MNFKKNTSAVTVAIELVPQADKHQGFYSHLFLVLYGSLCPVINLKPLNTQELYPCETFQDGDTAAGNLLRETSFCGPGLMCPRQAYLKRHWH